MKLKKVWIRNGLIAVVILLALFEVFNFLNVHQSRVVIVQVHQSQFNGNGDGADAPTRQTQHDVLKSRDLYTQDAMVTVNEAEKIPHSQLNDSPTNLDVKLQRRLLDDRKRHYKIFVGILSAKRDPPTVVRMAKELVAHVTDGDYKFAVWMSHSASGERSVISQLEEVGFEVYVSNHSYLELQRDRVRITHNDSLSRVIWRTTHVLDYANLLERSLSYDSDFALILEDDLKPAKHALDKTYYVATEELPRYRNWTLLTLFGKLYRTPQLKVVTGLGTFGGCTLLYKRDIIRGMIDYLRHDPYQTPVDLMIPKYIESLKNAEIYERTPNLFQHISPHSSYVPKLQKKEKRGTERERSITFLYDEDNKTLNSIPNKKNGYIGCFVDQVGPERRDLSGLYAYPSNGPMYHKSSLTLCRKFCKGYRYMGLQNGGECHCGNEFGRYGWALESECNKPCSQDNSRMCGGDYRNSVYRIM